jgi:hypothetical protein
VNADIDELVVPIGNPARSVFDALAESAHGVVGYGGYWIENFPTGLMPGSLPRFWNYYHLLGSGRACKSKWTGRPGIWPERAHPTAHYVRGLKNEPSNEFAIAHFRAINSAWKNPSRAKQIHDQGEINVFDALLSALERTFPGQLPNQKNKANPTPIPPQSPVLQ